MIGTESTLWIWLDDMRLVGGGVARRRTVGMIGPLCLGKSDYAAI